MAPSSAVAATCWRAVGASRNGRHCSASSTGAAGAGALAAVFLPPRPLVASTTATRARATTIAIPVKIQRLPPDERFSAATVGGRVCDATGAVTNEGGSDAGGGGDGGGGAKGGAAGGGGGGGGSGAGAGAAAMASPATRASPRATACLGWVSTATGRPSSSD